MTLLALSLLACNGGDADPIDEVFTGCDPIDPALCALPFPSSYFQVEDAEMPSGFRLSYGEESLPENRDNVQMRPDTINEKDGFSTMTPIMTFFDDLDVASLSTHTDMGASLLDEATTFIIDAETGERVAHFAEMDSTAEWSGESLLIMRPAAPLKHGHRYVVGMRELLKTDGSPVDVSDGFAALRDGTETLEWDTEGRRQHFEDQVFPVIESAGIDRANLDLAWDFVTVSEENSLGRVLWMRDDAAERVGAEGPTYTITEVEDVDCAEGHTIGRTIYLDMDVPMYTEQDEAPTYLTRDEAGMPYYNGDTTAEVMVRVPCSLIMEPEPAFVLQYGHGLLGSLGEARTGYLSQMAYDNKWIVVASDWVGMAEDDRGPITLMLVDDLSDFAVLPERSMQGFVQKDLALRLIRTRLADDDNLKVDGVSLVDPERFGYYGNSQGAILGGAYVGMSDQIERAVLGVGGAPYMTLLSRSADFDAFFLIFQAKYQDQREIALAMGVMQTLWDPAESSGWAWQMNQQPLDGHPAKDVLIQVAIGDAQVTTLGAHATARAYGATTIGPETREIWGVDQQEAPFEGSGIVEWFYPDGAIEPVENVPPDKNADTHECPRREPAAQQQLTEFLETGVINQHCEGICEGIREDFCD